jgi:hypothetical protein
MSILLALLLAQEPKPDGVKAVQDACAKLMEKKAYGFTTSMKVDCDDALKQVLDKLAQDINGVFRKDAVLHAKAEDVECLRNGGDALFLYNKKWRTREETNKLFKNKLDSPTKLFDTLDNPHDEIASVREKVASLDAGSPDTLDGGECVKYSGALNDDGATTLAKTYFGRLNFKAGKERTSAEPNSASGKATVWVSKDGLPLRLVYELSFKVTLLKTDYKASLVRTVNIKDIDTAKLEVPSDVKKRLKIAD